LASLTITTAVLRIALTSTELYIGGGIFSWNSSPDTRRLLIL